MKKTVLCILRIALALLAADLAAMGIQIYSHDYAILPLAYVACGCFLAVFLCGVCLLVLELEARHARSGRPNPPDNQAG